MDADVVRAELVSYDPADDRTGGKLPDSIFTMIEKLENVVSGTKEDKAAGMPLTKRPSANSLPGKTVTVSLNLHDPLIVVVNETL